jgi:hypothetical protein
VPVASDKSLFVVEGLLTHSLLTHVQLGDGRLTIDKIYAYLFAQVTESSSPSEVNFMASNLLVIFVGDLS